MRCPDCNKFVGYNEPQCETKSVELDGDGIHSSVTVQLNCQDCGTTLKDAEIEADAPIEHVCKPEGERDPEWKPDTDYNDSDDQFEIDSEGEAEGTDRMENKDRHGKPIKSFRYMKRFYGFTLESEVRCRKCGEVFAVTTDGEEQASSFNEC